MNKGKKTILEYINDRIEHVKGVVDFGEKLLDLGTSSPLQGAEPLLIVLAKGGEFELNKLRKEICDGSLDLNVISIEREP